MRSFSRAASARVATAMRAAYSTGGPATKKSVPIHPGVALAVGGGAAAAVVAAYRGVVPHEWLIKQLADPMMPVVRLFPPETAHQIAVKAAAFGLIPKVRGTSRWWVGERLTDVRGWMVMMMNAGGQGGRAAAARAGVRAGLPEPDRHGRGL